MNITNLNPPDTPYVGNDTRFSHHYSFAAPAILLVYENEKEEAPPAPKITSWYPVEAAVSDYEGASRTFNVSVDQTVNVSWLINGTEVSNQSDVTGSEYTNTSAAVGTWNVSAIASNLNGSDMRKWDWIVTLPPAPFDTGPGDYPSIMGEHRGNITPAHNVTVNRMYTYPCAGTGGHSEYVELYNETFYINATWNGYQGDYHNITFPQQFTLLANHTYNYTIVTGSYPQIHHTSAIPTANGWINCTSFTDANGHLYNNQIPAIRLFRFVS